MTAFLVIVGLMCFAWLCARKVNEPRPEQCEVCGKRLTRRQAREVTAEFPEELGGTSITATFCRKDAP